MRDWTVKALSRIARWLLLVLVLFWVLVPLYFLVAASVMPDGTTLNGLELPSSYTTDNYQAIFAGHNAIWPPLLNSTIVTVATTILALVIATPAAYGLSHLRRTLPGRSAYMSFFVLRGIPPISLLLPIFLVFSNAGLLDSLIGLVIALTALALPYCVWILRVTFDAIPPEVEEAASIDGAGLFRTFVQVVLPISSTGIAAAGILSALFTYVDYMIVSAIGGPSTYTFPIYITGFKQDFVNLVGPLSAAALIGALPMLVLFVFSQRYMRRLATAGIN